MKGFGRTSKPFFIISSFKDNVVLTDSTEIWHYDETAFAELATDEQGFAYITQLHKSKPSHTEDYVQVTVNSYGGEEVRIEFPFDRFYMDFMYFNCICEDFMYFRWIL